MLGELDPWIRDNPISTVINTHSNGDHWWGNSLMPDDARIITSAASLAAMKAETPLGLGAARCALKVAATLPLPGKLKSAARQGSHEFDPFDFFGVRRRYPDTTFTGSTTLTVGGRTLELREVGPAHTPGDLMVFDHENGVVFAGDILFVGQTPIMWEGPARNWIRALEAIIDFAPEAIVPGHGPTCGIADVTALRDYFAWLEAGAEDAYTRGIPATRAAIEMLGTAQFKSTVWARWGRPEIAVAGIGTQYRHLAGKTTTVNQFVMARTMGDISAVGAAITA